MQGFRVAFFASVKISFVSLTQPLRECQQSFLADIGPKALAVDFAFVAALIIKTFVGATAGEG